MQKQLPMLMALKMLGVLEKFADLALRARSPTDGDASVHGRQAPLGMGMQQRQHQHFQAPPAAVPAQVRGGASFAAIPLQVGASDPSDTAIIQPPQQQPQQASSTTATSQPLAVDAPGEQEEQQDADQEEEEDEEEPAAPAAGAGGAGPTLEEKKASVVETVVLMYRRERTHPEEKKQKLAQLGIKHKWEDPRAAARELTRVRAWLQRILKAHPIVDAVSLTEEELQLRASIDANADLWEDLLNRAGVSPEKVYAASALYVAASAP